MTGRHYKYVGPESIRLACMDQPAGRQIANVQQLGTWLMELHDTDPDAEGWATYTVTTDGRLRVAHRRTEHVACAGGMPVLGAGEVQFDANGTVAWLSHYSSGYCPDATCFEFVGEAFGGAGVAVPPAFSHAVVFRKCPSCGERNVIKDDDFTCALCEATVPEEWNF